MEALEAAIQADPGLRVTAVRLGGGGVPDDAEDRRLHGFCYPWEQDPLGIAGPLVDAPLEDLERCFTTVVKVATKVGYCPSMQSCLPTCSASSITSWESMG